MSAELKPHDVIVRPHPGGMSEVWCKGCGMNKVRQNGRDAESFAEKHTNLNKEQFKAYMTPPRGSEGESSN